MAEDPRVTFREQGFVGPRRVASPAACRRFLSRIASEGRPALDWEKGRAATSRAFFEMASHPAILDLVSTLLGERAMLWGASIVTRAPGAVHPWHSDIESCQSPGGTVSVWLGLDGTTPDSSLRLIPGSHRYGETVQQVRVAAGVERDGSTADAVLTWAGRRDPAARLVAPAMGDGEALFFDGRLWHGSDNLSGGTRHALLLQYALPATPIRIPDLNFMDWPFVQFDEPRPPCIMMRGSGATDANRFVRAPIARSDPQGTELTSRVHRLELPLDPDPESGWRPYPLFRGSTAELEHLSCHVSALAKGKVPHEPHRHLDEELLVVLRGQVELLLPELQAGGESPPVRLSEGELVYYPSRFPHSLRGASDPPANYLMFRWHGRGDPGREPLSYGRFAPFGAASAEVVPDAEEVDDGASAEAGGFRPRLLFEGPTRHLRTLHCHATTLAPGAGYEPHVDAYDVGIVLLEGELETLGHRLGPHGVIFYRAGEPHGMYNPGTGPARYLVFEFHGTRAAPAPGRREATLLEKLLDPKRWRRKLKRVLRGR